MKYFLFFLAVVGLCLSPLLFEKPALEREALQAFIPPNEDDALRPEINRAIEDVLSFYGRKYNMEYTRKTAILFGRDRTYLEDKFQELSRPHYSGKDSRDFVEKYCSQFNEVSGVITLDVMMLCINAAANVDRRWMQNNAQKLRAVLAHEVMHGLQQQLSGAKHRAFAVRKDYGPIWMVEGSANYMDRDFFGRNEDTNVELARLVERANNSNSTLKDLMAPNPFKRFDDYAISHLASFTLAQKFGEEKLFDYFRTLGNGQGWESSFFRTFEIKIESFMKEFEFIRRDYQSLLDWIEA